MSAEERGSDEDREDSEVQIGPRIAPVPLDLENKDLHYVGLGSYIVNSQASCAVVIVAPTHFVGGNPYLRQKKQFNMEATWLEAFRSGQRSRPGTSLLIPPGSRRG